jgi:protocatechuate 3,4-dioxygenase beta subunit
VKRKALWIVVVVAALAALTWWRCHGHASHDATTAKTVANERGGATASAMRSDPKQLDRGSIAGAITGEDHAPIAGARVCADFWSQYISEQETHDPRCATTDATGHYTLADLYAAQYRVVASARTFRPTTYHPVAEEQRTSFELHAGEHRTGVDLVLRHDGVEVTGTVSDVTGGPVPHAQVRASSDRWSDGSSSPPVESDDQGKFSLWVKAGEIRVTAEADGYAPGGDSGTAPGHVEILLTPESSLAGTVIDASTKQPVPGITVRVAPGDWSWGDAGGGDLTDDHGVFRVAHLDPGRYQVTARGPSGFGRSEGSVLVGLGEHVEGVVVKLFPAYRIAGKVVMPDGKPCPEPSGYFNDPKHSRWVNANRDPDGTLHADGVLPGTYQPHVECEGYKELDKYPPIEIVDKDATGLTWQVEAGATIRGRVLTHAGTPVEDVAVWARSTGGGARDKTGWASDESRHDGTYKLTGLKAGTHNIDISTDAGNGPKDGWKVDVAATATVEKDLILEDSGKIHGVVADPDGKPITGAHIVAMPITGGWRYGGGDIRSGDDGTFTVDGLRPGDYRVMAHRGWWSDTMRKPGSNDDAKQGERASVAAGKTSEVRIVVESQTGTIKGNVIDGEGKPVADAFVGVARESDAAGSVSSGAAETRWSADERPVVTATDGTFVVSKLSPGKYTLRAYRKGGGEAIAEHVAVGTTAHLQIKPTASLEGTVTIAGGSKSPIQFEIGVGSPLTGFHRNESFYRTDGHFAVHDLPGGHFRVTVESDSGKKEVEIDIAEGEHKALTIELDALVTVTGRTVDLVTGAPVPGIVMNIAMGKSGGNGMMFSIGDDAEQNISGDDGRFTLENAPKGPVTLTGFPKDFRGSLYSFVRVARTIEGGSTVDIGDIKLMQMRVKRGDPAGELGIHFAEQPRDTPLDQQRYKVSFIDPKGPAAKVDIKVGDEVTTIDGVDITGEGAMYAYQLMRAPPGTAMKLGLARGVTVTIVLAAP